MALNRCIWDPKLRVTNVKGANLKSLIVGSLQLIPLAARVEEESDLKNKPDRCELFSCSPWSYEAVK